MQKITPHLWFDKEAREAAEFYVSAFGGDSAVTSMVTIEDTPSGNAESVSFRLLGYNFMSISAGPLFNMNASVSFFVNFDPSRDDNAQEKLKALWAKLSEGGVPLMPLDKYPFSECYGWIQDKYGVSWQLILSNPNGDPRPDIVPSLLFTGSVASEAEEAMDFYVSIFADAQKGMIARYSAGQEPDKEGTVMYGDFMLSGQWFAAMDSAREHNFGFNEAVSFVVSCANQEEIDYFWNKLSAVPEAEQCGWCKDKYGLSWQIVPARMGELMAGDPERRKRVTQAFLPMKKLNIDQLEKAYSGDV